MRFWFIVGPRGLYVGTALTRRGMIREHLAALHGDSLVSSRWSFEPLSEAEKKLWAEQRRRGDRAVSISEADLLKLCA